MVAGRVPFPVDDGWKMRTFNIMKGLAHQGVMIDFIAFGEGEPSDPRYHELNSLCNRLEIVPRRKSYALSDLLKGLVFRTPFPVLNYYDKLFACRMDGLAASRQYDFLMVEDIVMASYARKVTVPVKFLDMHNVESHLMRRYAENESSPARRIYARLTAGKLARYERSVGDEFDGVFVCSEADRKLLKEMKIQSDIVVIPNGIDPDLCRLEGGTHDEGCIVFVGSMDYHANRSGIIYFVKTTFPLISRQFPAATLYIVGKNPGTDITSLASDRIIVTGLVDDVRPYLERAAVVVVPLLVGGGTRLKILEALAMGKAVVSTSLGCEGIEAQSGDTIYLEDTPETFAQRVLELLNQPELAKQIGDRGRSLVVERYDWNRITGGIIETYKRHRQKSLEENHASYLGR